MTLYRMVHQASLPWTEKFPGCYNHSVLAYALYGFFAGYALFLLGFAVFMYFENQKFGDNQFTVKLLPPPPRLEAPCLANLGGAVLASEATADWTPVPTRPSVTVYPSAMPAGRRILVRSR